MANRIMGKYNCNIFSRFSINFEADASVFLRNREEMFSTYIQQW